jgi:hypothetical protein
MMFTAALLGTEWLKKSWESALLVVCVVRHFCVFDADQKGGVLQRLCILETAQTDEVPFFFIEQVLKLIQDLWKAW